MSADRPPAPVDPGHSLNSILSGHAKAADRDSGVAEHRDDDGTLEPGPPRTPSAGRPLEQDPDGEPFTPPVPSIEALRGVLTDRFDDPAIGTQNSPPGRRRAVATALVAARLPRPSRRVAVVGLVVVVGLLVAALEEPPRSSQPSRVPLAAPRAMTAERPERPPATSRDRRRRPNRLRSNSRGRTTVVRRRSVPRAPVGRPIASAAQPPQPAAAAQPAGAPPPPPAAPGGSRFTSEFTP